MTYKPGKFTTEFVVVVGLFIMSIYMMYMLGAGQVTEDFAKWGLSILFGALGLGVREYIRSRGVVKATSIDPIGANDGTGNQD